MSEFLTVAAWAKTHAMSRQAGHLAVKRCEIPLSAEGKVDRLVADTLYLARTRKRARNAPPAGADQTGGAATPAPQAAEAAGGPDSGPAGASQASSRARKEAADAEMAEIDAARAAGRVLDRDTTERAVFEAFRSLRDGAFSACRNAAPMVLGLTELREIQQILDDGMRQAFADFEDRMQHQLRGRSAS